MIIRLHPLFLAAPNALHVVAIIGAATAFFAATIGATQWDIKKCSPIPPSRNLVTCFLACGVGAFGAALFHLMTHAFFKALMFLGSGSVIHAMNGNRTFGKMGGLKKYVPITHATFALGWLAIIGAPPLAGFFSKDEILWQAFSSPLGHPAFWAVGALAAACTAFYMTRLMALTFWGESRASKDVHPHESPFSMTFPLMVLGSLSVVGGWVGIPHVIGHSLRLPNALDSWLEGTIRTTSIVGRYGPGTEISLMGISVSLAGIAACGAIYCYLVYPELPGKAARSLGRVYRLIDNKYYVDELYYGRIIDPLVNASRSLWASVDVGFIDRGTYLASDLVKGAGATVRTLQNGNIQQYALYIALGVAATIFLVMR